MKITARPSPNFDDRKHPIDLLVLHYTGMQTGQLALDRMCDTEAAVSAHYMVWEDGRIVQLVGEDKRAWHAGVSSWQGDEDLNSRSIGVEIVNGGHDFRLTDGRLEPFPKAQIDAVIELCSGILERWDIPQSRIVGHSDIAPARKEDPGEHFPWAQLAAAGIGIWPQDRDPVLRGDEPLEKTGDDMRRIQADLTAIGYTLVGPGPLDEATAKAVTAFQRRWVQDAVTGKPDPATSAMIDLVRAAILK